MPFYRPVSDPYGPRKPADNFNDVIDSNGAGIFDHGALDAFDGCDVDIDDDGNLLAEYTCYGCGRLLTVTFEHAELAALAFGESPHRSFEGYPRAFCTDAPSSWRHARQHWICTTPFHCYKRAAIVLSDEEVRDWYERARERRRSRHDDKALFAWLRTRQVKRRVLRPFEALGERYRAWADGADDRIARALGRVVRLGALIVHSVRARVGDDAEEEGVSSDVGGRRRDHRRSWPSDAVGASWRAAWGGEPPPHAVSDVLSDEEDPS